jgi:hypothetical protein
LCGGSSCAGGDYFDEKFVVCLCVRLVSTSVKCLRLKRRAQQNITNWT